MSVIIVDGIKIFAARIYVYFVLWKVVSVYRFTIFYILTAGVKHINCWAIWCYMPNEINLNVVNCFIFVFYHFRHTDGGGI